MHRTVRPRPKLVRRSLLAVPACAAVGLGVVLIGQGLQTLTPPPQPSAAQGFPAYASLPTPVQVPAPRVTPPPRPLAPSTPTRVRIPAIGVNAPLTALALQASGQLAAPASEDRNLAGWYRAGTSPGAVGTAVIAGHVDTDGGPAVFYNLGALGRGALVDVDRADGVTAEFTVDAVEAYASEGFPSRKVYGPAGRPELRLITCGAGFDKARQEYLGNVVAFAHLTGSHPTAGKPTAGKPTASKPVAGKPAGR